MFRSFLVKSFLVKIPYIRRYQTTETEMLYVHYNQKGEIHREDGPAKIWHDGYVEFYLDYIWYSKSSWEDEIIKRKLRKLKKL